MAPLEAVRTGLVDLLGPDDQDNHFGLTPSTFRLLVENAADGVLVVDEAGGVLYANAAAAKIFGRSREDLLHVPLGRPLVDGDLAEIRVWRPDQTQAEVELRVVEVRWNGARAALANLRDVSALRRQQERQRQVQKLEALGRLAAGIAHDFRNLIAVVEAGVGLVRRKIGSGAPAREIDMLLDEVLRRTGNAESLTAQLLAFSRKQELKPQVIDVNERLRSITTMLGQTLGGGVNIRTAFDDTAGAVEVDANQFDVAILNLAVNARDAMASSGTLTIATARIGGAGSSELRQMVRVTVTDTGSGMDIETKANAFEPFFTSKPDGAGTGLGLSQVYGFVTQSGGKVQIESEVGQGTEVHLYLPRHGDGAARDPLHRG